MDIFRTAPIQMLLDRLRQAFAPTPRGMVQPRRTAGAGGTAGPGPLGLVRHETRLSDSAGVERFLPDILGRALARGWIDPEFRTAFLADPKALLETYGVFLPRSIFIRVEADPSSRERLVVYEMRPGQTPRRLLYLQLVMRAGK